LQRTIIVSNGVDSLPVRAVGKDAI